MAGIIIIILMLEEHLRLGWGIGAGGVLDTMGVFHMPLIMDIRLHMAMATRHMATRRMDIRLMGTHLMGTALMDMRPRTLIRQS